MPTAEFVRRRLSESDDIGEAREEIEALLAALEATAPAALKSVDDAMASISAISARLDAMKAPS